MAVKTDKTCLPARVSSLPNNPLRGVGSDDVDGKNVVKKKNRFRGYHCHAITAKVQPQAKLAQTLFYRLLIENEGTW